LYNHSSIVIIILLLITGSLGASIINVPDEEESIQAGITASEDGDTVLVQPGEYEENINFNGHNIVLASLFLTSGNPDFISETIIDGAGQGSVVKIRSEESPATKLIGFTIINGSSRLGGGISVTNADPQISHCIITNNSAEMYGGGIYTYSSNIIIKNCVFTANEATNNGGGILIGSTSTATILRCLIANNEGDYCSGIDFNGSGSITNCTIVNISLGEARYGMQVGEDVIILNSILWTDGVSILEGAEIYYSAPKNGVDGGEGNIFEDPLFVDFDNGDYHIAEDSPCIDSGDPDGDADADGTRSDMGMFPLLQGMLVLEGMVFDNMNDEGLDGALISTSYGDSTYTDTSGFWRFSPGRFGTFEITASFDGYIDSTIADIELDPNDTLEVIIQLLHPVITPAVDEISIEILVGETIENTFSVENSGDGVLELSAKVRFSGDVGSDPGALRQSIALSEELNDNSINGVIYTDDQYYLSGQNGNNPMIYVLDKEGRLEYSFEQPFDDEQGFHDISWDGESIWGGIGDSIFSVNLEGEITHRFRRQNEREYSRNVAYDTANDWIWICESRSDIFACNVDGEVQNVINLDGRRTYGIAYWEDDPDGFPLYVMARLRNGENGFISKINPENGNIQFVTNFNPPIGSPRGSYISSQMDDYSTVILTIADLPVEEGGDRIDIWQLHSHSEWMTIDPAASVLNPNDEQDFFLSLEATDLLPLRYPSEIVFSHNAIGGETIISLELRVVLPDEVFPNTEEYPQEYAISEVYPNPFNSIVLIKYAIPLYSKVSISVYDLSGSLVDETVNGMSQSGMYATTWNAEGMASGVYFVRMRAGDYSEYVKIVLVK